MGYCQAGRVVKEAGEAAAKVIGKKAAKKAGKETLEATGKKVGKEAAEITAEKAAREMAEESAEKAAVRNAGKAVANKEARSAVKKEASEISNEGMERALRRNVEKVAAEKGALTLTESAGEAAGKGAIKAADRPILFELEEKEGRVLFEEAAQKGIKEKGENVAAKQAAAKAGKQYTGKEAIALLDDNPILKKQVAEMEEKLGPLFSTDNIVIKKSGSSTIVEFPGTNTVMHMKGDDIIVEAGSTMKSGAMNEFLNHPLPNKNYIVDGGCSKFVTDKQGRTVVSECHSSELSKRVSRGELPAQNKTPLVESKGGKQGIHDSGHIQQHSTGGQNESINLLPMKSSLQRGGAWAKLEKQERDAIEAGCDVWSKKKIVYHDDGSYDILVDLIIDGKVTHKEFTYLF